MIMILEGELYTTKRKIIRQNQSSVTLFETPCNMHGDLKLHNLNISASNASSINYLIVYKSGINY